MLLLQINVYREPELQRYESKLKRLALDVTIEFVVIVPKAKGDQSMILILAKYIFFLRKKPSCKAL